MAHPPVADLILRSPAKPTTRILFIARHPPIEPAFPATEFPGDGGYPGYYARVCSVLRGLGYDVRTANRASAPFEEARNIDLVFSLFNRMPTSKRNPEVIVTAIADLLELPSVGASSATRAVAEDKWFTKALARSADIPVSDGAVYERVNDLDRPPPFPGPYFVKNRRGAASEGISEDSIQDDWAGALPVVRRLLARGMGVLVERYVPGLDITVPCLGSADGPIVLGVVKPGSNRRGGIITEDLKRDDPLGYEMFDVSPELDDQVRRDAAALWAMVGPMDYFRIDYRLDPTTGRRVFLEFNICCHIGRSGAICLAARGHGLEQPEVLGHVVEYSLARQAPGGRA